MNNRIGLAVAGVGLVLAKWWFNRDCKKSEKEKKHVATSLELPTIDLNKFLNKDGDRKAYLAECKKAAEALHKYGALNVKDPRVEQKLNCNFLDMMEKYFEHSDGKRDARPELSYQVGVTPSHVEKARDRCGMIGAYTPDNKPLSPCPPEKDPKWRFFWRIGPRPEKTQFKSLNAKPVVPPEIPEWTDTMNIWGNKMIKTLYVLAEMVSVGFDLPSETLPSMMKFGPHLLAPTGSNFNKYGKLGTVLAGFHVDLNFMTIHGKSRFPGLYVWTREGKKAAVKVPDGCLLVQAGKQLEYLTGGHVLAGFHEVVVSEKTIESINRAKEAKRSLWRVSSTCFSHIASDQTLKPLAHFATEEANKQFPPILAGNQVLKELEAISLKRS